MIKRFLNTSQSGINQIRRKYNNINTSSWLDILTILGIGILLISCIGFVIGVLFLWPFALAWAINSVFSTTIPYNFVTWLSFIIIAWVIRSFTK